MTSSPAAQTAATAGEPPIDLTRLDRIIDEFKDRRGAVIPILQRTQDTYGYLPREALKYISRRTMVPLNQLYGVATFYSGFHLSRRGRHLVRICDGTACHVRGAAKTLELMEKTFGVGPGQTTPDYKLTVEVVYCLGSCGLSPVALVDDKVVGRLAPEALMKRLKELT